MGFESPRRCHFEFPKANGAVEQSVVLNGGTELRDPEHTEINCGNPVRVRKRHPSWELISLFGISYGGKMPNREKTISASQVRDFYNLASYLDMAGYKGSVLQLAERHA